MPVSIHTAPEMDSLHENFALIVPYYAEAFKLTDEECSALEEAAAQRFIQRRASSSWAAVMCVVDAIDAFCSHRQSQPATAGAVPSAIVERRKAA